MAVAVVWVYKQSFDGGKKQKDKNYSPIMSPLIDIR